MSGVTILGLVGSIIILLALFEMMRRHRLREKYALIWALVALAIITVAAFPSLLSARSRPSGWRCRPTCSSSSPRMVIMVLTLQHSSELGRLEERTRTLAEEIALLRLEIDQHRDAASRPPCPTGRPSSPTSGASERRPAPGPARGLHPLLGRPRAALRDGRQRQGADRPRLGGDGRRRLLPRPDASREHFAAEDDPRIRYVRNEINLGITDNYQRCRELASGELMMFLGCDDLMHPTFVETVTRRAPRVPRRRRRSSWACRSSTSTATADRPADRPGQARASAPRVDRRTELGGRAARRQPAARQLALLARAGLPHRGGAPLRLPRRPADHPGPRPAGRHDGRPGETLVARPDVVLLLPPAHARAPRPPACCTATGSPTSAATTPSPPSRWRSAGGRRAARTARAAAGPRGCTPSPCCRPRCRQRERTAVRALLAARASSADRGPSRQTSATSAERGPEDVERLLGDPAPAELRRLLQPARAAIAAHLGPRGDACGIAAAIDAWS